MNAVNVIMDVDTDVSGRNDVPRESYIVVNDIVDLVRMPNGTTSGASSVAVVVDIPDGRRVMIEMTMNNFLAAAVAFTVREQAEGLR